MARGHDAGRGRTLTAIGLRAIGLRKGTAMGKDQADPAGQDPERGTPGSGSTIPKSKDGVWATSTPGHSSFEPEEDAPGSEAEDVGTSEEGS